MPAFDSLRETDTLEIERVKSPSSPLVPAVSAILLAALFAWTSHLPSDPAIYWTWVAPVLLGVGLLVATRRRLSLTSLSLALLALLGVFLMLAGGHVSTGGALTAGLGTPPPLEALFEARAFLFGLAATILIREILLRKSPLLPGKWLSFLCVSVSLTAFQALAVAGWSADALLQRAASPGASIQEYLLVYAGAASSLLCFRRLHDRQVAFLWMDFTKSLDWCVVRGSRHAA